ncbi:MAG TPA: hypothetical protein VHV74_25450 [Pseudonocardiaceae bacterium]|nr:hypothetical protein [Pseudonocardiaceae bacterium]
MIMALSRRRTGARRALRVLLVAVASLALLASTLSLAANAATGVATVSGVLTPFNGAFLDSTDGGHYWDAGGNGLCRVDVTATGSAENPATCDAQSKAPTQVAVGARNADGTDYLYVSDMSSNSGGPVRLTYDPAADSGAGRIEAGSAVPLGGPNTTGFFSDPTGTFRNSSIALGPCHATVTTPCTAVYLGFEKSKQIERIDFADQPVAQQSIETISKTDDIRKGVRFGIGDFHNADGTDDLYIDELGGEGVSVIKDVAHCTPSNGSSGGCAATVVPGITTNSAQGMAVQDNPDGTGRLLYVGDAPENGASTVLRYDPGTGFQDVVSTSVTPYPSLLNPGQTVSDYTAITGLAVDQHNGDLYVGDDPSFAAEGAGENAVAHLFTIAGDGTGVAPADCVGSATRTCRPPAPPSTDIGSLYAYGVTAPVGGAVILPSDDGGHVWAADESMGLCRFGTLPAAPGLHASDPAECDDGNLLVAGGQAVWDDSIVPGTANQHYVYVADNAHLSPGVIRFAFDPSADHGAGGLVPGSAVVMAPNAGVDGDRANGLALGPCPAGAPSTCKHALYVAGFLDGFVRRIDNPEDAPRNQRVEVVAETTDQRNGAAGRGINGTMGMIGDDLYLPEDSGFTVVQDISACPLGGGVVCPTTPINIGVFGSTFGAGVAVDTNPAHSVAGLVYASDSPGSANATVYQYDVATNTSRVYLSQGQLPPAGTAEATVACTLTCTRPADPNAAPGSVVGMKFVQGLYVDPRDDAQGGGTLYVGDDAFSGSRSQRGHLWTAPFVPYPSGVTPVPLVPVQPPSGPHACSLTVPVPALPVGESYWVQFTTHATGTIETTWTIPVAQSAQLLIYPGTPLAGLPDPTGSGALSGAIAEQVTTNTRAFDASTAPATEPAGTYTVQFVNGGTKIAATTATLSFTDDAGTSCPASPLVGHVAG